VRCPLPKRLPRQPPVFPGLLEVSLIASPVPAEDPLAGCGLRALSRYARVLDLICDRSEHVTSRYVRDPTAARGTEHRTDPAERFVISAEDQAETIVLRTALDARAPANSGDGPSPLGNQVME
jgi:hypothetical protein